VFERRLYHHIDWALVIAILALCALGVVMINSTTADPTRATSRMYLTQLYAIVLGLGAMVFMLTLDYRTFTDKSHLIYIGLCALLLYVLFFGMVQMGARRWIPLRIFNLQPSEFAKVGVALVLAKFFGENRGAPAWTDLAIGGVLTLIPFALIAKEPDLGTAVTLLPVFLAIAYLAGMQMRIFGVMFLCLLLAAPVAWKFALKDYQKSRISTFLDPSQDAKGAGYQQIQARITVGSGGLTGKGFKKGTQGQLRFLPVAHNDFIFSVLAEEQGFAGVLVALGLYLFVILRALEAARLAKDRLGSYLVLGVLASFTFQVIYNVTMSAGLAPVKGLTLPLMSYGGSSMIATLAGFGLVLNVRMRRFTN
jgi:rod shape determining protein RodA